MWNDDLLLPMSEINELLLGILRGHARSHREEAPPLVAGLRELWRSLDDDALGRLARCPFLLLDAGLDSPERWQPGPLPAGEPAPSGYFDAWDGISMVRHALVFARYLARSHRSQARILLGLQPQCADLLANRSLRDLELLAGMAPDWIRPRWASQPLVWRQMLQAAMENRPGGLRRVQQRGLQLMAVLW